MRLVKWLVRRKLDHEIRLDVRILENLADQRAGLEGMKLSRFDKVLGLNRERVDRVYRGRPPGGSIPPTARTRPGGIALSDIVLVKPHGPRRPGRPDRQDRPAPPQA